MDGKLRRKASRVIRHGMDETFGHSSKSILGPGLPGNECNGGTGWQTERAACPESRNTGQQSKRAVTSHTPLCLGLALGTGLACRQCSKGALPILSM